MNGKQDTVDLIRKEIIDSDISGKDLRIVLDILNKYKKVQLPLDYTTTESTYSSNYCEHCSNNPKNGGSGICHCVLGTRTFY